MTDAIERMAEAIWRVQLGDAPGDHEWMNLPLWMQYDYRVLAQAALDVLNPVIDTVEQLDALPPESIVKTEGGTVACRFYDRVHGVVFGDDRPFKWPEHLASELPARLLWSPSWRVDGEGNQ